MEGVVKEKDKHMDLISSRLEALENHNANLKSDVETKEITKSQFSGEKKLSVIVQSVSFFTLLAHLKLCCKL